MPVLFDYPKTPVFCLKDWDNLHCIRDVRDREKNAFPDALDTIWSLDSIFKHEDIDRLSVSLWQRITLHCVSAYTSKYQPKPWNSHQEAEFDNLLLCYGPAENLPHLAIQEIKRDLTALCRRGGPAACSIHSCDPTMMAGGILLHSPELCSRLCPRDTLFLL